MSVTPPAPHGDPPSSSPVADRFFSAAIPRMLCFLIIFGAAFTLASAWRFGWVTAVGFAAGACTAYLSFRSLHKAVRGLAARIVDAQRTESGFSLVHGFFLRYLLAGAVAYVIFTSS